MESFYLRLVNRDPLLRKFQFLLQYYRLIYICMIIIRADRVWSQIPAELGPAPAAPCLLSTVYIHGKNTFFFKYCKVIVTVKLWIGR